MRESFHYLTPREQQVLRSLADGYSIEEISNQLNISHRTVEANRIRIMIQLGINDLAGLVKYAIIHNFTSINKNRGEDLS